MNKKFTAMILACLAGWYSTTGVAAITQGLYQTESRKFEKIQRTSLTALNKARKLVSFSRNRAKLRRPLVVRLQTPGLSNAERSVLQQKLARIDEAIKSLPQALVYSNYVVGDTMVKLVSHCVRAIQAGTKAESVRNYGLSNTWLRLYYENCMRGLEPLLTQTIRNVRNTYLISLKYNFKGFVKWAPKRIQAAKDVVRAGKPVIRIYQNMLQSRPSHLQKIQVVVKPFGRRPGGLVDVVSILATSKRDIRRHDTHKRSRSSGNKASPTNAIPGLIRLTASLQKQFDQTHYKHARYLVIARRMKHSALGSVQDIRKVNSMLHSSRFNATQKQRLRKLLQKARVNHQKAQRLAFSGIKGSLDKNWILIQQCYRIIKGGYSLEMQKRYRESNHYLRFYYQYCGRGLRMLISRHQSEIRLANKITQLGRYRNEIYGVVRKYTPLKRQQSEIYQKIALYLSQVRKRPAQHQNLVVSAGKYGRSRSGSINVATVLN